MIFFSRASARHAGTLAAALAIALLGATPGTAWVPGHWRGEGPRRVWVPGHAAPAGTPPHRWVPGHWTRRHGQRVFVPGRWR